ncbi:iron ABC transporter permease [Pararhizobium sp. BT-229]|uniref:FecCD family ABC transporter permease n=1 Tax=Pararhizobium sp. BT-229 TaxID=2986923 RepID=UPI0021F7B3FE|nr:iron ABC transporter permease [Pararhizobium sp. BT-229]MCV9963250.1 iron ABC transporter permease [Pararhizobium sp. BT-229]
MAATLLLAILHLSTGARPVPFSVLVEAATVFDPGSFDQQVLLNLRLPRLVAALICGASSAMAGLLLQSLLRNPLGEPHILGLNAGASLAVVASAALPAALQPQGLARSLLAASGGGALFLIVLTIASAGRVGLTMTKLIFCGIALSALASAFVSAILILDQDTLEQVRLWLVGDLAGVSQPDVVSAFPMVAAAMLAAAMITPRLDAMALGDASATGLGVPVRSTRFIGLCAAAALSGAAVTVAGPIAFIGLIVPAIARKLAGGPHLVALALAATLGAALLVAADIAARNLLPSHEIATGITTALVGAPVFLLLVARTIK